MIYRSSDENFAQFRALDPRAGIFERNAAAALGRNDPNIQRGRADPNSCVVQALRHPFDHVRLDNTGQREVLDAEIDLISDQSIDKFAGAYAGRGAGRDAGTGAGCGSQQIDDCCGEIDWSILSLSVDKRGSFKRR